MRWRSMSAASPSSTRATKPAARRTSTRRRRSTRIWAIEFLSSPAIAGEDEKASAQRHTAARRLVELGGDALDTLGRRGERRGDGGARGLVVIERFGARVPQGDELVLELLDAPCGLGERIGDGQRRHDGEPGVADLAEFLAQALDADVEIARQIHQVAFLAVLARHPELPAVDGDADLGHLCSGYSSSASRPRTVSIACARRCATSRLAVSSARARAMAWSSSPASRERSLPSAWTCADSVASLRNRSRRRSAAASSASSASARRRLAASIDSVSLMRRSPRPHSRRKLWPGRDLLREAYVPSSLSVNA